MEKAVAEQSELFCCTDEIVKVYFQEFWFRWVMKVIVRFSQKYLSPCVASCTRKFIHNILREATFFLLELPDLYFIPRWKFVKTFNLKVL